MRKNKFYAGISLLLILGLFMFFSYLMQKSSFGTYLDDGFLGMLVFVIVLVLSIVLAPVSAAPLFPIAASMWGVLWAGVLGAVGWTLGAMIAFYLARRFGVDLVKHFLPIKKINKLESKIPEDNVFLTVVFLRMIVPFDGVSYLFGLFSKMKLWSFTLATFIGIIPFSFVVSYIGTMPFDVIILIMLIAFVMFVLRYLILMLKDSF